MRSFLTYEDGMVESSHLCHMFYLASLGFNIVPGAFTVNGVLCRYESSSEGIKLTRDDGESMVIPFRAAMGLVSKRIEGEA